MGIDRRDMKWTFLARLHEAWDHRTEIEPSQPGYSLEPVLKDVTLLWRSWVLPNFASGRMLSEHKGCAVLIAGVSHGRKQRGEEFPVRASNQSIRGFTLVLRA